VASALPPLGAGQAPSSAPAGAVGVGPTLWTYDGAQGFAPLVAFDTTLDPLLAVGVGIHLPIQGNVAPATCGQLAYDGVSNVYVTQGVLANNTASTATGILRVEVDPNSGQSSGGDAIIAANSRLGGNQPTAVALGPDGNLYFGNLKNGDIKRILNPGTGTTQVVQSAGKSPSGRPLRAMTFVGNDLYLAASDSLSVISNATSTKCTGGCNAVALSDGFSGTDHVGVSSDGVDALYFAVAGTINQEWRYSTLKKTFTEVAAGGVDRTGTVTGNFAFVGGKTNLLSLDASGTLWAGDDTSSGTKTGAGRLWTISSALLASITGGVTAPDPQIVSVLHGPWFADLNGFLFTQLSILMAPLRQR